MDEEQLRSRLNEYKTLVEKNIPNSPEDNYFSRLNNISARVRAAYLEVVVYLNGNEDDFKRCLELSGAPTKNLHNCEKSIDDILADMKAYAHMIKNSK